jgi:signal transduction histidine kinase
MAAASLKRRLADQADMKSIERVLSAGERMDRMISQLLDLTRGRLGGGISIERTDGDLSQAVLAVVDELRLAFTGREIHCEVGPNVTGPWDLDRLAQVVSNLLGNALVHGDTNGTVHVRLDANDDVILTVHNPSKPISESELDRIFDPYRRSGATPRNGLGLGLFIAKQIVLAHDGRISVASTVEGGTTFTVVLPRLETPPAPDGTHSEQAEMAACSIRTRTGDVFQLARIRRSSDQPEMLNRTAR